jgi:hypothetical protein
MESDHKQRESIMLHLVILAATLWVCPGNVFSNEPREGCKPFEASEKEGFNITPEAPGFSTNPHAPVDPAAPSGMRRERQSGPDSVSAEMCALYKEYIELELKTQGGFLFGSPTESERWQTLKRMFQNSPVPSC